MPVEKSEERANLKRSLAAWMVFFGLVSGIARAQLADIGNGLINHPAANMTWESDGHLFATMAASNPELVNQIIAAWGGQQLPFDHVLVAADFETSGSMNYFGALAWINYLNDRNYKGYNDWRLPDIGPARHPGICGGACYPAGPAEIATSEWWRLFSEELGGTFHVSIQTTHNANYDLFAAIGGGWSRNGGGDLYNAFGDDGAQGRSFVTSFSGAWPVRTGISQIDPPPRPRLLLSNVELVFPTPQVTLTTSAPQTLTLTNKGAAPSSITTMVTTSPIQPDEFVVANDCPAALAVGASCAARVTFRPQIVGTTRGTLTITADGNTYPVSLTGTGALGVELTASAMTATAGAPVTLTWKASTVDIRSCDASGGTAGDGWTGLLSSGSGSRAVTSPTAGRFDYEVRCIANVNDERGFGDVSITYTMPTATISANSTNIQQGQANTLAWSSANATGCVASSNGTAGQWSGARGTSGTATVTETTLGMITYTVSCTSDPQTAIATVNVFVNAPPSSSSSSGGGGGSFDWLSLLGLMSALAVGWRKVHCAA